MMHTEPRRIRQKTTGTRVRWLLCALPLVSLWGPAGLSLGRRDRCPGLSRDWFFGRANASILLAFTVHLHPALMH